MVSEGSVGFVGRGGQGVVLAATVLAEALFREGYYVTQLQSYGAEVRGGSVLAYVTFSEEKVVNPFKEFMDYVVVLHDVGLRRWGELILKSKVKLVSDAVGQGIEGGTVVPVASKLGEADLRGKESIAFLGVLAGLDVVKLESILKALEGRKDPENNRKAVELGFKLASELRTYLSPPNTYV